MVSDVQTKNRLAILVFCIVAIVACFFVWRARAEELGEIQARITSDDTQIDSYTRIIAQKKILLGEYQVLSRVFLAHQTTVAGMESSFTQLLSAMCRRDSVSFIGVNYGDMNGSAPPAPAPRVDLNGQAIASPPPDASSAGTVTDLSANHIGDPAMVWPSIPAALFTRVPATVTLKGDWKHLIAAVQDIPQRNMLIVVSNPDVKRLDSSALTLSFEAQILAPAVTVHAK